MDVLPIFGKEIALSIKTITEKTVAKDNIHAFGVVAQDNTQLETGSLVMMGGKYWFVVNPKDSAKLKAVLDAKLSKRFQMVRQNPKQVYEALPVELKSPEAQTFRSNFCLRYDTQKAAEIAKLKQLAFKPVELDGKTVYTRCIATEGHYYATPKNVAEDRRFDTAVPVRIYYVETKKSTRCLEVDGEYPENAIYIGFGRSRRSDSRLLCRDRWNCR